MSKDTPTLSEIDLADEERLKQFLRGDDIRSKTDLKHLKSADFHLAPEKPGEIKVKP